MQHKISVSLGGGEARLERKGGRRKERRVGGREGEREGEREGDPGSSIYYNL